MIPDLALQNVITGSAMPGVSVRQVDGGTAKDTYLKGNLSIDLTASDLAAAPHVPSFTSDASVSDGRAAKSTVVR